MISLNHVCPTWKSFSNYRTFEIISTSNKQRVPWWRKKMSVTFVDRNFIVALIDAYSSSIIKRQGLNIILITRSDSFINMIIRLSVSESTVAKTCWSLVSTIEEFTVMWLMLIPMRSHKLTHLCRVTHICVSKSTIIVSDNGLSPDRRQAIIWTNAEILLIGTLGTTFSEILIKINTFSFKKMHLKMSSQEIGGHFVSVSMC